MRYLKNFSLYEANVKKSNPTVDLINDAMINTPAGKDLAAMARSYSVSNTGKLTMEGLRSRTYVQQDSNGVWNHWVVSNSNSYGEGKAATLEECLRDCWRGFVLNSVTFRPKGMKIKKYLDQITPHLHKFEGKGLDIYDLQWEIKKILDGTPNPNPIKDPRFVWDHPELQWVFDFIGLDKNPYHRRGELGFWFASYRMLGDESPLAQILPYKQKSRDNGFRVVLVAVPEDDYRDYIELDNDKFEFGGDVSKKQEYKERFIRDLIPLLRSQTTWPEEEHPPQAMLAAAAIETALNGEVANLAAMVADLVHDVSKLVELPEPLRSEVMSKKGYEPDEIEAASTSKQYGLI